MRSRLYSSIGVTACEAVEGRGGVTLAGALSVPSRHPQGLFVVGLIISRAGRIDESGKYV